MHSLFYALWRAAARRRPLLAVLALLALASVAAVPMPAQSPGPGASADNDAVSPQSPRASIDTFLRLADAESWEEAAEHLIVPARDRSRASTLARRLKVVLDQRLDVRLDALSPLAVGDTADGDRTGDVIGTIAVGSRDIPVRLVRVNDGAPYWRFSSATVEHVDGWFSALGAPFLRDRLPESMMREGPLDVFYWQWLLLGILVPLVILLSWVVGAVLRQVTRFLVKQTVTTWDDLLLEHLRGPFRLWAGAILMLLVLAILDLNPRVNGFLTALTRGLALIALFWALLRLIGLVQGRLVQSAVESGQAQARTLVPLLSNILRVAVAIAALLVALSQFGYPVTTLLAGLGIGGIAVALAAQKTVEHLFGSVSLAADRAFRVGDWVRVGNLEGEVERIGLRSTSIRTIERTVVRVPNGRLADDRIETFGERDRMLLRTNLDLTYETTAEQFVAIRDAIETALRAYPATWPDRVRVYLTEFGDSAIRLNVTCWLQTTDTNQFLRYRHELMLQFMRIVQEHGSSFAFPSRTVYHVGMNGQPLPAPLVPPVVD